jgi:hypothetical protein
MAMGIAMGIAMAIAIAMAPALLHCLKAFTHCRSIPLARCFHYRTHLVVLFEPRCKCSFPHK